MKFDKKKGRFQRTIITPAYPLPLYTFIEKKVGNYETGGTLRSIMVGVFQFLVV